MYKGFEGHWVRRLGVFMTVNLNQETSCVNPFAQINGGARRQNGAAKKVNGLGKISYGAAKFLRGAEFRKKVVEFSEKVGPSQTKVVAF